MNKLFHSVKIIEENCKGCTKCMNLCPMEAVRLKNSKAIVYEDKCIDCGECIRTCPYSAHVAERNSLEEIKNFKVKIAIPSVTLYAQFGDYVNPDVINNILINLGFDDVFDITYACDVASEIIKKEVSGMEKPAISVFCPSVARLINIDYPELRDHVVKVLTPVEIAAALIRERYSKSGYKCEDIGVFYISSCVSWITRLKETSVNCESEVNGTFALNDIYGRLLKEMQQKKSVKGRGASISFTGLSWAFPSGMSKSIGFKNYIAVDGVNNVKKVFNDIENGHIKDVDFIEAYACSGGCLGGVFLIENPYNARRIINKFYNNVNFTYGFEELGDYYREQFVKDTGCLPVLNHKLAEDFEGAVKKMRYMNELINRLPGTDCGQCGSPSCKAFAEDVVRGLAVISECKMLKKVESK